jgi:hypothetical protein
MGATIGMIIYYGEMGGLQLAASIPLAIFSGLFMFGTSAAYLAGDVEQEAGPDRPHTTDAPPSPAPSEPWFIREASPWPGPLEEDMAGEEALQPVHGGVGRLR